MIQGALMLSGIIFPIMYFVTKKNLKSVTNQYIEVKKELDFLKKNIQQEVLKYTKPIITTDFGFEENIENKKSNFDYSKIEYYREKKIDKQFLYPIKNLEDTGNFFFGKKVVITGDFEKFKNRNEIAKLLWEAGADVDVSCGKYTDCLIVGDNAAESKIEFAEEFGVNIFYEENFLEEFNLD